MDLFESSPDDSGVGAPLATRMRPGSVEEYAGQRHLLGKGKLLRRMIDSGRIGSMILYGPPSCGKTTLAHVIAKETDALFLTLNAVLDGVGDFRKIIHQAAEAKNLHRKQTVLFVDEIHRWNKAQQDALLPHIESGLVTLIGATTLNPFYALVGPLLSRCQLFELVAMTSDEVQKLLLRALEDEHRGLAFYRARVEEQALEYFASQSGGDVRHALNALEMAVLTSDPDASGKRRITLQIAKESIQQRYVRYDRTGDEHFHYASAFIKSMRGSDPDAALYWLTAMLEGGEDPNFVFRRMYIFASEDIGLADPFALTMVDSAHSAFEKCGMPEGYYFLSQACLYLALAPKSNSTSAIFGLLSWHAGHGTLPVPAHLKDKTANAKKARWTSQENASDAYIYPHDYPGGVVDQQYLPDGLSENTWYKPGTLGQEAKRWADLMHKRDQARKRETKR